MVDTSSTAGRDRPARQGPAGEMYETSRRRASRLLAGEPDLTVFATWCLGLLQGVEPGGLRHAACDGVLAALEAHPCPPTAG